MSTNVNSTPKELTRKLGFWPALALAVGTTIGSGIFINSTTVAQSAGSPNIALWAWIIGGLICIPQMMVLAEMSSAYPKNGGGYVYLKEAGLKPIAFLYGWTCFLGMDTPGISLVALSTVTYVAIFFPILNGLIGKFLAVALILILASIHFRSVKVGGFFQVLITALKVAPFAIIIGIGIFFIKGGNYSDVAVVTKIPAYAGLVAGVSATTWAYSGMAGLLDMAGEFKNPGKTLPRAMIGSAGIITVIYTLVAFTVFGLLPFNKIIKTTTPITDALKQLPVLGGIAPSMIAVLAIIVMLGCLSSLIMYQPRLEYAMAKDGLFFKKFGHVNSKFETPDFSIIVQVGISIILIFSTNIVTLLGYITLMQLIENAILYAAIFACRKKADYKPIYKCPAWILMTILSIGLCAWMAWGTFIWAPIPGLVSAVIIVATGLPCYYYWDGKRKKALAAAGTLKEG